MNKEFVEHHVFEQLSQYIEFYDCLAERIFGFVQLGTKAIFNIDTYVFSSIRGTLESIKEILAKGRVNDSYALLRKYYDSAIINIYTDLYLDDNFSISNFVVDKINNWLHGTEKLPEYRVMSQYIHNSPKLSKINQLLYKDSTLRETRERCNDNTHYNSFFNILLNDNEIVLKGRMDSLNKFSIDLDNIFIMHFSYIFFLKDIYMMASDYTDNLDCGLEPEPNSQYLVAPFVQEVFDNVIKKKRMDLASEIINNTPMRLQ